MPRTMSVPVSRRAQIKPPPGWGITWTNDPDRIVLVWDSQLGRGDIQISRDSWARVHAGGRLTNEWVFALDEAKSYPGAPVFLTVPPQRSGAKAAPRSDLRILMDDVTTLAGQVAVSGPEDALELSARYGALHARLEEMRREFAQAEGAMEMACSWLTDETRRRSGSTNGYRPEFVILDEASGA